VENVYTALQQIYSGNGVPNFIKIARILSKILHKHFGLFFMDSGQWTHCIFAVAFTYYILTAGGFDIVGNFLLSLLHSEKLTTSERIYTTVGQVREHRTSITGKIYTV